MCMWKIIMNIPEPGVIVCADGGVGAPKIYDSDERKGIQNDQTIPILQTHMKSDQHNEIEVMGGDVVPRCLCLQVCLKACWLVFWFPLDEIHEDTMFEFLKKMTKYRDNLHDYQCL